MDNPGTLKSNLWALFALVFVFGAARGDNLQDRLFSVENDPLYQQVVPPSQAEPERDGGEATSSEILTTQPAKPISRGGAMLRSLIIPGWGESYLGFHGKARAFFWTDVALWATVIGLETFSRWKEDQFISFAGAHAGANLSGKSDAYYADIGNYDSTEEYNEAKLRNRDYNALYTNPDDYWAWDSGQNRMDYDHMRIQSRSAHDKIYIFMGAAALNRLISFIDTGKKARDLLRQNPRPVQLGVHVEPGLDAGDNSVRLVVNADF